MKDGFYDEITAMYDACLQNDIKIIIGGMNAQVGREQIYQLTIGRNGLHQESNDNGRSLSNFSPSRNMVTGGILFEHKKIIYPLLSHQVSNILTR
jgi:hypothetical protein